LKTQVCIIGSGPAGLLLGQLLTNAGIDTIILDRQSREHIEGRIRAGVLEWGSVEALREAGVGERMDKEGLPHDGFDMGFDGVRHRIDLKGLADKQVMVYGQTEITKDLFQKRADDGGQFFFNVEDVQVNDPKSDAPSVKFTQNGERHTIECQFVAGCDGFHGVSRKAIPMDILQTYERIYPFGWLGVLTDRPPVAHELIYANSENGFALCSMRSNTRSRYYIQCSTDDSADNWSDEQFWDELEHRIGAETAKHLQRGPSIEKSIAPLRSFVAEPMRYGNLFLAGDAAHIVPPTGAKGLNLAIADVLVLSKGLIEYFKNSNSNYLDRYSESVLKRVWKVERFSWYMSHLLHRFPDHDAFDQKMQRAEFDHVMTNEAQSKTIAENYVGLPLEI